jgi:hypothetical protein
MKINGFLIFVSILILSCQNPTVSIGSDNYETSESYKVTYDSQIAT